MTTVLPGAGLEVEDDVVDGKRVYPIGGIFFGAKGSLGRVTSSNPLPVTLGGAQEISGLISAELTGSLPAGSNVIGGVTVAGVATSSGQDTANSHLSAINAKLLSEVPPTRTGTSGTITAGGTAQTIAADDPGRRVFIFQNTSDTQMRVCTTGTASAANGIVVASMMDLVLVGVLAPTGAVSVYCATTGKTFWLEVG